jgi:hypothetical protein
VIRAAAVCPHPPLLFRELAGRDDAAGELRGACLTALRELLTPQPGLVVVVGGDDASRVWEPALTPRSDRFRSSGQHTGDEELPLSLGVGRRLLEEAGWRGPVQLRGVAWDASADEVERQGGELAVLAGDTVLLVLGDGSARRGDKAPGYVDQRAFAFDEDTVQALRNGDAGALLRQDANLAAELMASGRAAFGVLAAAALAQGAAPRAAIHFQEDPFGVMYVVATWHL